MWTIGATQTCVIAHDGTCKWVRVRAPERVSWPVRRGIILAMRSIADNAKVRKKRPATRSRTSTAASLKRHEPGKLVRVRIMQHLGAQPLPLLEKALEAAGFWTHIARVHSALGRRKDQFRIVIKPDLDFYNALPPGGTDPALVEHLIDLLHDRGF